MRARERARDGSRLAAGIGGLARKEQRAVQRARELLARFASARDDVAIRAARERIGLPIVQVRALKERGRAGFTSPTVAYWRQAMGVDASGSANEKLEAASPAAHADKVRAPVLLIHGHDDTVVPIAQSQLMQTALAGAGKSVELVELEGEDHWLSGATTRLKTLQAVDAFLTVHLGE